MRYFAYYNDSGELVNIGTVNTSGKVIGEITEAEYNALLAEILENAANEDVQQNITGDEFMSMIEGVL